MRPLNYLPMEFCFNIKCEMGEYDSYWDNILPYDSELERLRIVDFSGWLDKVAKRYRILAYRGTELESHEWDDEGTMVCVACYESHMDDMRVMYKEIHDELAAVGEHQDLWPIHPNRQLDKGSKFTGAGCITANINDEWVPIESKIIKDWMIDIIRFDAPRPDQVGDDDTFYTTAYWEKRRVDSLAWKEGTYLMVQGRYGFIVIPAEEFDGEFNQVAQRLMPCGRCAV